MWRLQGSKKNRQTNCSELNGECFILSAGGLRQLGIWPVLFAVELGPRGREDESIRVPRFPGCLWKMEFTSFSSLIKRYAISGLSFALCHYYIAYGLNHRRRTFYCFLLVVQASAVCESLDCLLSRSYIPLNLVTLLSQVHLCRGVVQSCRHAWFNVYSGLAFIRGQ